MTIGRSLKMDPRRPSSSYCSTATIVVFVALCLVGVWMMTSSSGVPVDMSSSDTNSEVKNQVSGTTSRSFEDSSGDIPDDAGRTDDNSNMRESLSETESESSEDQSTTEKTSPSIVEKSQEDNPPDKGYADKKDVSEDASGNKFYTDENDKTETSEIVKEVTEKSEDGQEDGEEKNKESPEKSKDSQAGEEENSSEQKTQEITGSDDQKNGKQASDETENNEEIKSSEQDSSDTKGDERQKIEENNASEPEDKSNDDSLQDSKDQSQKVEQDQSKEGKENTDDSLSGIQKDQISKEVFPDGAQSELLNETNTQNGAFSTQATESKKQKEMQNAASPKAENVEYSWKFCNVIAGADYIPCLDNVDAIKKLRSTKHYEHRERHCPDEPPTCLVPLPEGYKRPIQWPNSRDKIWYHNVPHTKLAAVKGHQNWVKLSGEYLTFPGGGTQFKNGALHYIDFIQGSFPELAWGKRSRIVLDVGCGVASFGGFLFERDVLTMSFAPKDEHEAQVQFALERGIPAISAVMGTKRLPFPSRVFDIVHCARCRVPWHIEGGMLLLELNRLLRPGGFFVWSATPVYQKLAEDVEIWEAMSALTESMCWEMVNKTKDGLNQVGLAIYRKPSDNKCYERRKENNPPLCQDSDDPNAAWNISLQACMHKLPVDPSARGSQWPEKWPERVESTPYWLNNLQAGVYGKPAAEDFQSDYEHWKHVISNSYLNGMGIDWSNVRNVMDMRAVYGGFAAALLDLKVWVMNIVSIDSPDTLPVIYERGLFGMYHNWCESFGTYPRTYDLLHADHLFSRLKTRCKLLPVVVEVDRILRPEGKLIVRDTTEIINEIESIARSLNWEVRMTFSKDKEGLLCVQKTMWRPTKTEENSQPLS